MTHDKKSCGLTRREFTKTTILCLGAMALPIGDGIAQGSPRYHRLNATDPGAAAVLRSYKRAIRAMLALPPDDPRNWYRQALIHTLDCPHGNWWFLPWHRAYIGWFEQICRELSGDSDFTLPYWDWTENSDPRKAFHPRVPAVMFDDVLTPTNPAYVATFNDFYTQLQDVVAKADYWKPVYSGGTFADASPYGQLLARSIRFPKDLWFDINDDPRGIFFFPIAQARGLTELKPEFDEKTTLAVALTTLLDALSPRDFITFGSPKTQSHSALTGFGVLEGQPHNRVHNCVGGIFTDEHGNQTDSGGFMQNLLSPVDPLFFLHHANIDRLWDVWTRKQEARKYPILPDGYLTPRPNPKPPFTDFELWSRESFPFFVDSKGQPVKKTTAGNYAAIGDFSYDYQPGSGEEIVATAVAMGAKGRAAEPVKHFEVQMSNSVVSVSEPASGKVTIPLASIEGPEGAGRVLFAKITLGMPSNAHAGDYKVLVNGPADATAVGPSSPFYAGTLSMFGHHTVHCPVTFIVPLSRPIAAMRTNKELRVSTTLNIRVVAEGMATHPEELVARTPLTAEIISIVIEAH
jgi:tyrosinase